MKFTILRENTKESFSQMCLLMNLNEYRGFLTQWISQFVMLAVQENGIANLEVNGTLIHVHETKRLVLMTLYTEALLNIYS